MSWLIEEEPSQIELANEWRRLVETGPILQIPGTHDGMAARMAKQAKFQAIYLSGAAYTASRGLPDLGLIYSNEVADRARELVRASGLPLLVDIDTGYGGVLNVARTAKEMVEAKVAAVQIEDQGDAEEMRPPQWQKLISSEEMCQKIRTLKAVSPTLYVLARTDAKGVEGMAEAISRAKQYLAAGADAIFPEALESEADFVHFRKEVDAPLLANMTEFGKTPYYSAAQFESWGFRMVLYPVSSLRVAAKAYERVFEEIREQGTQKGVLDQMQTRSELYRAIRYEDYEALDGTIARSTWEGEELDLLAA